MIHLFFSYRKLLLVARNKYFATLELHAAEVNKVRIVKLDDTRTRDCR